MLAGAAILEPHHALRRDAEQSRPPCPLEPCTPAELRALVHGGETDSDAVERLLVKVARSAGALDLAIGAGPAGQAFQPDPGRVEALRARLEAETDRWSFLESQPGVPAPCPAFDDLASADEIDATLRQLASQR